MHRVVVLKLASAIVNLGQGLSNRLAVVVLEARITLRLVAERGLSRRLFQRNQLLRVVVDIDEPLVLFLLR